MKKLYKASLLLFIVVAFTACKKSDSTKVLITGTWKMQTGRIVAIEDDKVVWDEDIDPDSTQITFFDNGKGRVNNDENTDEGFSYTLSNNKLTIIPDDTENRDTIIYDVQSLTETELKMYLEQNSTEDGKKTTVKTTVTYVKVN